MQFRQSVMENSKQPTKGRPHCQQVGLVVGQLRKRTMTTGTVKWFNDSKGFGFITPDGGGRRLVRTLFVNHHGRAQDIERESKSPVRGHGRAKR